MKMFKLCVILFFSNLATSQQVFRNTGFPARDFFIKNDTVNYIEKRHVIINGGNTIKSYFIGGYGLEIYDNSEKNEIITVSNELRNTVCSVRFYNKSSNKVEDVYYYTKGRALDAIIIKELNYIILSLNDKHIVVLDFSKKPEFVIKNKIQVNNISRRMTFYNGKLYYATDDGEIYKLDINSSKKERLLNCKSKITDFVVFDDYIVYCTIKGDIVKWNSNSKKYAKIKLTDNFVLNNIKFQKDRLIFGTFNGNILVIESDLMTLEKEINYHKRSILKIYNYDNHFYSSSIDQTIKKWELD